LKECTPLLYGSHIFVAHHPVAALSTLVSQNHWLQQGPLDQDSRSELQPPTTHTRERGA
jgi:hypothetical protein